MVRKDWNDDENMDPGNNIDLTYAKTSDLGEPEIEEAQ